MHAVVCHLRKDKIWDCRIINYEKEKIYILLCQHLFLCIVGGIVTCFDSFLGSSSGVHQYYLASELRQ
jgi:hypothetical protein